MVERHRAESLRRRWLCIAYAFPPIQRSGTHRTLGFVRHLEVLGWDATVLTVHSGDEPVDVESLRRIPKSTSVVRTRWVEFLPAIKRFMGRVTSKGGQQDPACSQQSQGAVHPRKSWRDWISRFLMTPDSRVGWIPFAIAGGLRAIREHRPEVIYSTSPYASAHLVALLLCVWSRIPWVADFRDPWIDNPFRHRTYRSLNWLEELLERAVFRFASRLVFNTQTSMEAACRRVARIRGKSSAILNGLDAEPLEGLSPIRIGNDDDLVIAHAGEFYGMRSPKSLFDAFQRLKETAPADYARVCLVLIGPTTFNGIDLVTLAERSGIGDRVKVLGRKVHRDALSILAGSDALLLMGSAGPEADLQVPQKLFEYLGLKKPILAAIPSASPVVSILSAGCPSACLCPPDDAKAIASAIQTVVRRQDSANTAPIATSPAAFDRAGRARELADLFEQLVQRSPIRTIYQFPELTSFSANPAAI